MLLFDSTVTVWDLVKQEQINVLQRWGQRDEASGHTGGINAVVVTQDGTKVLTVSKDCTARVWDVQEARTIHVLSGECPLCRHPEDLSLRSAWLDETCS